MKFRHLVANMSKPTYDDKRKLENKEMHLQNMRIKSELKRNVTVTVSSEHFYKTGIMCDVVQVRLNSFLVAAELITVRAERGPVLTSCVWHFVCLSDCTSVTAKFV